MTSHRIRVLGWLLALCASTALGADIPDAAKGAKGLDSALNSLHAPTRDTKALSAIESLKHFKLRPGYAIDLIATEPTVRQPLNINFDARGRMWVTQYIQYPFPKGLKIVEYDRYIRAKFDKTPLPPPRGDKGTDRITIHEDSDGDGTFDKTKVFVDGLNIATSALPGKGGVWVMNPPYLLFYPDANGDDAPDADPVVHLSGFGLQDTHAVANSLTWGPDGWIYGGQGSTCTAKVKVEVPTEQKGTTDFSGQAIWRYHPQKHLFEIFAEGGGNTFGVEFDDKGRVFSGTNWGNYRGLHFVQGGYYLKGWGKHGPLTNPYAFGFFDHMPHTGDARRLTHTFSVYSGGLMPELTGKIIGPNPLQSCVTVTRIEPAGSSFKTMEEEPLLVSDDGWFRPVDLKVGQDGAIYICDFYENRISHVDPRDTWDRSNGRLWRIRPMDWKPAKPIDWRSKSGAELVGALSDPNRLIRSTARRMIGEREDKSLLPTLRELLTKQTGQPALEGLWAIHQLNAFDENTALAALNHSDPDVRRWGVRLLADNKELLGSPLAEKLIDLAKNETNPEARGQLASSAKRLPGDQAIPILRAMLLHAGDEKDVHIPLLLWWAVEAHLATHRDPLVAMYEEAAFWKAPLARTTVAPRLARALAAMGSPEDQHALVRLIDAAPAQADRKILFAGVNEAYEGRQIGRVVPELASRLARSGNVDIAARSGDQAALDQVIASIANDDAKIKEQRIHAIELLGQVAAPGAVGPLLKVAKTSKWHSVRRAALAALTRFNDPTVAQRLIKTYPSLPTDQGVRAAAINTLLARKAWSRDMLKAVEAGAIPAKDLSAEQRQRLGDSGDRAIAALLQQIYGQIARPSSQEKEKEIARIKQVVSGGTGDPKAGKMLFTARCAVCHTLFKEGAAVGPDLTTYDRRNLDFVLVSVVDPSAAIREEYTNFRIDTQDDETFVGLIKERGANSITLMDALQQRTVIAMRDIKAEQALSLSVMPEGLLTGMDDQQLRDFFAYVQSPTAVK
jgi:putative heme-binding domain-containing protein